MTLRQLRRLAKLTQADVAARAGLHQTVVSNLETGRRQNPRLETLERLAVGLNTDVTTVLSCFRPKRRRRPFETIRTPEARGAEGS